MMKNRVEIEGILQEAPELKSGSSDGSVLLATARIIHRRERRDGEPITYYFNVLARNEMAEKLARMRAGDGVAVVGRLTVHSWVDPRNQFKRTIYEIFALEIEPAVI